MKTLDDLKGNASLTEAYMKQTIKSVAHPEDLKSLVMMGRLLYRELITAVEYRARLKGLYKRASAR